MAAGFRDLLSLHAWTLSGSASIPAATAGTRDLLSLHTWFLSGTAAAAAETGNALFVDTDVEVFSVQLRRKDGSPGPTMAFSQWYFDADALYPSSPYIYPLLVEPPATRRGIGNSTASVAIRYDIDIRIYGRTSLDRHGRTLLDLLDEYEFHGAPCSVAYYPKPRGVQTTHVDAVNFVQTLEVTGRAYDSTSGVLTLKCSDTWFRDREISKRLGTDQITALGDQDWINEYGALVFGSSTVTTDGIMIDAPIIDSDDATFPETGNVLQLFSGWSPEGNPNYINKRLMVKNQHLDIDDTTWLEVHIQPDPDAVAYGNSGLLFPDAGDNYARSLSLYSRGIVVQPSSPGQAEILVAVDAGLKKNAYFWAADFPGSQILFLPDSGALSPGDKDFTFSGWINADTLQQQGIAGAGNVESSGSTSDWVLFMNSSNKFAFRIYSGPSQYVETVWGSAASAGTWYYVLCWHDQAGNTVNISVNNAAAVSTSTAINSGTAQGGGDDFITLAAGASSSDNIYNDAYVTIVAGTGVGQTKKIKDYAGSTRKAKTEANFGKNPDNTSVYAITVIPKNTGDVEQKKAFQLGFAGNGLGYFDGKIALVGFWNGVLDPTYRTSVYNSGSGKAFEELSDSEKFNLQAWWDLSDFYGKRVDKKGSLDLVDTGVPSAPGKRAVTSITAKHGELQLNIYRATLNATSGAYEPDGSALRTAKLDPADIVFSSSRFMIEPALVMSPTVKYFFELTWSNKDDHPHSIWSNYQTTLGAVSYARLNSDRDKGWEAQTNVELDLGLYCLGYGDSAWTDTVSAASGNYSVLSLRAFDPELADIDLRTRLEFKIGIFGVTDVDGTYTGTPSSVISDAASVIFFVLAHPEMLNLTAADSIDAPSFDAVRLALLAGYGANTDGFHPSIVIDRKTSAEELISDLCRQARIVFYKARDGKLKLHYPRMFTGADYMFEEASMRGGLVVLDVVDNTYDTVINDVKQLYAPDALDVPKDPAFIRRAEGDRYNGLLWSDEAHDVGEDPFRQDLIIASQTLYGRREHRAKLDDYDNQADALAVHQYYIDRYNTLQKQVRVQVPRKLYYNVIDLFSRVSVSHSGIQFKGGTAEFSREHHDGTATSSYYEGVNSLWWSGGNVRGEVVDITSSGPDMILTVETMSAFNS